MRARGHERAAAFVICIAAALAAGGCFGNRAGNGDGNADSGEPASMPDGSVGNQEGLPCGVVGRSVACVGPGGCSGGQACQADGTYGACDCGAPVGDGGAPETDAAMPEPVSPPACGVGAACEQDSDCPDGFFCVQEQTAYYMVEGLPTGERRLARTFYPGGMCSPVRRLEYDTWGACDPFAPLRDQGCGDCGACGGDNFDTGLMGACAEACTPSIGSTGCSRPEYTCDLASHTCRDGCVSDATCKFNSIDTNNDGLADLSQYDSASPSYCDDTTLRCRRPGTLGAQAGDPCTRNDDCEADGFCYTPDEGYAGLSYSGGYCSKEGCDTPGLECEGDGVCVRLRSLSQWPFAGQQCMQPCTQGNEPANLQFDQGGHGDTCRVGYMCLWGGKTGDASGVCVPGNYNDVTENNLGAFCTGLEQCYSPMGHGTCIALGTETLSQQLCIIQDCDAPGLPSDVCGPTGECVLLQDGRRTACLLRCDDASQCPTLLGCIDVDSSPNMFFGVCYLGCESDSECRTGETCVDGICQAA